MTDRNRNEARRQSQKARQDLVRRRQLAEQMARDEEAMLARAYQTEESLYNADVVRNAKRLGITL